VVIKMKFLYGVKGCSHCDMRGECTNKNSKVNLLEKAVSHPSLFVNKTWESACSDFVKVK